MESECWTCLTQRACWAQRVSEEMEMKLVPAKISKARSGAPMEPCHAGKPWWFEPESAKEMGEVFSLPWLSEAPSHFSEFHGVQKSRSKKHASLKDAFGHESGRYINNPSLVLQWHETLPQNMGQFLWSSLNMLPNPVCSMVLEYWSAFLPQIHHPIWEVQKNPYVDIRGASG